MVRRLQLMQYKLEQFIENSEFPAIFIIQKAEETQILRHWHKEIEITYVAKGKVDSYFIEGKNYTVNEGEAVFVNPFEIHGIRNIKETSYPDSVLTIIFPTPWIEKYFPDIAKFRINQSKISQESVTKKQYAMFISELDSLFELVKKPVDRINNVMITASLLKLLGMYVKEFAIEQAENSSHLLDEKIYKILDYIHKNSDQRLKISMIADEFYLSEGYLSRYFNSKVGVSIISYLELIRSYQAIQLIRETDRTIEEIALETGFASTKSLNKTLKKYYNQTAKFFR
ncbi:AraC family transcriptional regulator [Enterococcus thailandicus]|nr:AraC family transcriptional regulator [Enterococcus thailandicus]OJG96271.1 hypothetical protein RV17_GL000230 [Enterococcus thailandicus]